MVGSSLIGLLSVFRHGQRTYPPPFATSWAEAATAGWTNRPQGFPEFTGAAWNMTPAAFAGTELAPHGKLLHEHLGQHAALQAVQLPNGTDLCSLNALFVADDVRRDLQSAQAFASGFFPAACATEKAAAILLPTAPTACALRRVTLTMSTVVTRADRRKEAQELFSTDALTARYGAQFCRVGEILGCCSASLCAKFGLRPAERIVDRRAAVHQRRCMAGPVSAPSPLRHPSPLHGCCRRSPACRMRLGTSSRVGRRRAATALRPPSAARGSVPTATAQRGSHLLALLVASLEQLAD